LPRRHDCQKYAKVDLERGEVKCAKCGLVLSEKIMFLSPSDWKSLGGYIPKWKRKKHKCPQCGHEFYLINIVDNCPKCNSEVRANVEEEEPVKETGETVDVKARKVTVKYVRITVARKVISRSKVYFRSYVTKDVAITLTFTYRRKKRSIILPWILVRRLLPSLYQVWAQRRLGPRKRNSEKIRKAVREIHETLSSYGLSNVTTITAALTKLSERRVQQLLSEEQKSKSHVERGKKGAKKAKREARKKRKETKAKRSR